MLYPFKFEPIYKAIIWGGRNLEKKFKRNLPEGNIAESWEVCCRSDGISIVLNGPLKGISLQKIMEQHREELLGSAVYKKYNNSFPLLIKLIDANDKLSVQVHPDDEYALYHKEGSGKTEMWYVVDAKPEAKLIYGLKGSTSKEDLIKAIEEGKVGECLKEVPVKSGDALYIPSGTVHAILDGILIAEIQQNSNTTYRLYDWGRVDNMGKGRELHIDKALEVINFQQGCSSETGPEITEADSFVLKILARSKYFTVEELLIKSTYVNETHGMRFYIYMIIDGEGLMKYTGGHISLTAGETVLVPACTEKYEITGSIKALKVYI